MSASTIEWTEATWNPVRGCSIVSKGCTNCYAMRVAHRHGGKGRAYEGLTKLTKAGPVWTGEVRTVPEMLDYPLRLKRPHRIFVNSMSDLFHEDVPGDFIDAILDIMKAAPRHTFQTLTKRPARMLAFMRHYKPLPNLWLGVSVEDQASADERIPLLLQTPAAVRWISAEPLLGPVEFRLSWLSGRWEMDAGRGIQTPNVNWVVAGGESGPAAREMSKEWARSLRDQCAAAGVPFFFKQWGEWAPDPTTRHPHRRVGKKRAGRLLDGRTHDEYPRP